MMIPWQVSTFSDFICQFFQALVSRWIRLVSRWIRLVVAGSPSPIRKKQTDRVFLSSACESLDQACEPLDQACRLKQPLHPVFVVALSTVMWFNDDTMPSF